MIKQQRTNRNKRNPAAMKLVQTSQQPLHLLHSEIKQSHVKPLSHITSSGMGTSTTTPKCMHLSLSHIIIPKKTMDETKPEHQVVLNLLRALPDVPSELVQHHKKTVMIGLIQMLRALLKRDSEPVMIIDKLYIGRKRRLTIPIIQYDLFSCSYYVSGWVWACQDQ